MHSPIRPQAGRGELAFPTGVMGAVSCASQLLDARLQSPKGLRAVRCLICAARIYMSRRIPTRPDVTDRESNRDSRLSCFFAIADGIRAPCSFDARTDAVPHQRNGRWESVEVARPEVAQIVIHQRRNAPFKLNRHDAIAIPHILVSRPNAAKLHSATPTLCPSTEQGPLTPDNQKKPLKRTTGQ